METQSAIGSKTPMIQTNRLRLSGLTLNKGIFCFIEVVLAVENFSLFKVNLSFDEEGMPGIGPVFQMEELLPVESIPADIGIPSIRDFLFGLAGMELERAVLKHVSVGLASVAEVEISMDDSLQLCAEVKIGKFFCKRIIQKEEVEEVVKFDGDEELLP